MESAKIKEKIENLKKEIQYHSEKYYQETPEITDAQFDAIWHELETLEKEHPHLKTADSPTQKIQDGISELYSPVKHKTPMLSLQKAYTEEEVKKFLKGFPDQEMSLWIKFDGMSLSLTYEKGKLTKAVTRGNGEKGEDITANTQNLINAPKQLKEPIDCEIRGEAVMLRSDWQKYNQSAEKHNQKLEAKKETRKSHYKDILANPRNGVVGALRGKDRNKYHDRPITFMPFDIVASETHDIKKRLEELGFKVISGTLEKEEQKILEFMKQTEKERENYDFELDGVVIKVADRETYEKLGNTSHHPRGAIAWKPAAETTTSILENVIWQVGKSGRVAPVAIIKAVFLGGTTIKRASLHNIALIESRDIRIGDHITITRAGDVIPHVSGPVTEKRQGHETKIEAPTQCPSCQGTLIEEGESRLLQCENTQGCPEQSLRRLIHWAGRQAADIDAVGQTWIETFNEAGLLNKVSDFYKLQYNDLRPEGEKGAGAFDSMGEGRANKMLESIEKSKNLGFRKAWIGWSVPLAGEGTAKRICKAGYNNIEEVMILTEEELEQIEDIGPIVAKSIKTFLAQPATIEEIKTLRELGVNLDVLEEDKPSKTNNLLMQNKKIVFTGKLEKFTRSEGEALAEQNGAKASSSVSSSTDYVVAGPGAGSKLAKAEKLGVKIISEEEFLKLIETK